MANAVCTLGFATFIAIAALALIAVGVGTNEWQRIRVKASDVALEAAGKTGFEALAYLNRDTGLFRICFNDTPIVLDAISDDEKASPNCIKNHHEIKERNPDVDGGSNYMVYVHLMRTVIALLILCLLLLLIGIIVGCLGCWGPYASLVRAAGILVLLATLFGVAGMAVWMGAEYIEREKVTANDLKYVIAFPKAQSEVLHDATTKEYGYSFVLCWVGVVLALVAAIIYLAAVSCIAPKDDDDRDDVYKSRRRYERHNDAPPVVYALDSSSYTQPRNPRPQPVMSQPAYQQQAYPQHAVQQQVAPPVASGQYYDTRMVSQDNSWGWNK